MKRRRVIWTVCLRLIPLVVLGPIQIGIGLSMNKWLLLFSSSQLCQQLTTVEEQLTTLQEQVQYLTGLVEQQHALYYYPRRKKVVSYGKETQPSSSVPSEGRQEQEGE
jgi:hypothetical protein